MWSGGSGKSVKVGKDTVSYKLLYYVFISTCDHSKYAVIVFNCLSSFQDQAFLNVISFSWDMTWRYCDGALLSWAQEFLVGVGVKHECNGWKEHSAWICCSMRYPKGIVGFDILGIVDAICNREAADYAKNKWVGKEWYHLLESFVIQQFCWFHLLCNLLLA